MPEPSKTQRQPLSFTATDWKDDKAGGTPITAAQLNRVEKGIQDAVRGVNDINTRIMSYLVQSDGEHATQDANGAAIVPPCYIMDWSTKTTWFDNGTDPRFTPFATAEEMKAVRDSLSRKMDRDVELSPSIYRPTNPDVEFAISFKSRTDHVLCIYFWREGCGRCISMWDDSAKRDVWHV